MDAVATLREDQAVRKVLEWLELFIAELLEDLTDDFLAPALHLVWLVRFVLELIGNNFLGNLLDLRLEGTKSLVTHGSMESV